MKFRSFFSILILATIVLSFLSFKNPIIAQGPARITLTRTVKTTETFVSDNQTIVTALTYTVLDILPANETFSWTTPGTTAETLTTTSTPPATTTTSTILQFQLPQWFDSWTLVSLISIVIIISSVVVILRRRKADRKESKKEQPPAEEKSFEEWYRRRMGEQ